MTRTLVTIFKGFLWVSVVTASLASSTALAQIQVEIFPPAAFIATSAPVYFEGHATYWWGNQWYYRDGRNWRAYREEPAYLHEYRGHHVATRQHYESHGGNSHQQGNQHANGSHSSEHH